MVGGVTAGKLMFKLLIPSFAHCIPVKSESDGKRRAMKLYLIHKAARKFLEIYFKDNGNTTFIAIQTKEEINFLNLVEEEADPSEELKAEFSADAELSNIFYSPVDLADFEELFYMYKMFETVLIHFGSPSEDAFAAIYFMKFEGFNFE